MPYKHSIYIAASMYTGEEPPYATLLVNHFTSVLQGVAINFVKSDDIRILRDIEQYYSTQVDEMVSFVFGL